MIATDEMKKKIERVIPSDKYEVQKLTKKHDGYLGYRITLFEPEQELEHIHFREMDLELNFRKQFYEPDYREEYMYIQIK
jgi:hypothetical protein